MCLFQPRAFVHAVPLPRGSSLPAANSCSSFRLQVVGFLLREAFLTCTYYGSKVCSLHDMSSLIFVCLPELGIPQGSLAQVYKQLVLKKGLLNSSSN